MSAPWIFIAASLSFLVGLWFAALLRGIWPLTAFGRRRMALQEARLQIAAIEQVAFDRLTDAAGGGDDRRQLGMVTRRQVFARLCLVRRRRS